ncbi:MAG: hypothetical protein HY868_10485 [Chloroflexi bacterium]|nr:hypothetical protein [Chloroflexota bacterium]
MDLETVRFNLRDLFLVLIVMIGGLVFCSSSLANGDPLWFLPYFNETPKSIVVYREGCRVTITPGQPGFDELTRALNAALSQIDGYDPTYGLPPDSLRDYREKQRALEVTYPKRVKIHVAYKFGEPDTLFIPLTGPFGETRSIFGGHAGDYWASALRLKSNAGIRQAAEALGCATR